MYLFLYKKYNNLDLCFLSILILIEIPNIDHNKMTLFIVSYIYFSVIVSCPQLSWIQFPTKIFPSFWDSIFLPWLKASFFCLSIKFVVLIDIQYLFGMMRLATKFMLHLINSGVIFGTRAAGVGLCIVRNNSTTFKQC